MKTFRTAFTLSALGAGAVAVGALVAGNRYLDRWQNLAPEDVAEGEFCQLGNGWRIHYRVQGRGSPVVFVHGFMDSLHTWQRSMDALAANYRVVALDMPGFGCSERVTAQVYSLKRMSQVLNEFLTLQGIERATIVGHSLGGALALQYTYDFPERVDKLVLESAAVYLPLVSTRVDLSWIPAPVTRGALGLVALGNTALVQALMPDIYGATERADAELMRRRAQATRVRGSAEALLALIESPRDSDLPGAVSEINTLSLIIWGGRDHVVPLAHGRRLRSELPRARLAILTAAGHLPHEEFPEQVNEWINRFLENGLEQLNEARASDGLESKDGT